MFAKPVVELDRRRFLKGENENPFTRVFTLTQTFLTFLGFTQNGHVKISLMIFLTNGTHTHMFWTCIIITSNSKFWHEKNTNFNWSCKCYSSTPTKKQIDSSVKLTVKGITPMINSELAASIIVPPIISQTRTFHIHENRQEIHRYYLDQEAQQGFLHATQNKNVNAEVVVSSNCWGQEQITRLTQWMLDLQDPLNGFSRVRPRRESVELLIKFTQTRCNSAFRDPLSVNFDFKFKSGPFFCISVLSVGNGAVCDC